MTRFDLIGPASVYCRLYFERRGDGALFSLNYHHEPGYDGRHRALAFHACDDAGVPGAEAMDIPARDELSRLPTWIRLPADAEDEEIIASCRPDGVIQRSALQGYAAFVITPVGEGGPDRRVGFEDFVTRSMDAAVWRVCAQDHAQNNEPLHDCPSADEAVRYLRDALPFARLAQRDFTYLVQGVRPFAGDYYTVATRVLSASVR